jgi:hypothetical protein
MPGRNRESNRSADRSIPSAAVRFVVVEGDPAVQYAWHNFASQANWSDLSDGDHDRFIDVTRAVSLTGASRPDFAELLRAEGLDRDEVAYLAPILTGLHEMVMTMWGKGDGTFRPIHLPDF